MTKATRRGVRRSGLALTIAGATIATGAAMVLSTMTSSASAATTTSVTLCHGTASSQHPYNAITVSGSAIQKQIFGPHGHSSHTGPIFDPSLGQHQADWGDIIPPFSYSDGTNELDYAGLNWSTEGQAIWADNCELPDSSPSSSSSAPTSPPVESTSPDNGGNSSATSSAPTSTDPTSSSTDPTSSSAGATSSSADPTSSSADPTSSSADPTSSSADPTSGAADPTSSSADPTSGAADPTSSSADTAVVGGSESASHPATSVSTADAAADPATTTQTVSLAPVGASGPIPAAVAAGLHTPRSSRAIMTIGALLVAAGAIIGLLMGLRTAPRRRGH